MAEITAKYSFSFRKKTPAISLDNQANIVMPILSLLPKRRLALVALAAHISVSQATSVRYEAQVLDRNGQPCFTVEKTHLSDAPRFASIDVLSESEPLAIVWRQFAISGKIAPIIFFGSTCLLYGTKLENGAVYSVPQKLETGRHYVVTLSTDVSRGSKLENRRYRAHFCLASTENGGRRVHQVFYDEATTRWDLTRCPAGHSESGDRK